MLVVDSIWKESGMCGKEILTIKILSLPSSYVDAKVLHWKVIILRVVLLLSVKLLKGSMSLWSWIASERNPGCVAN